MRDCLYTDEQTIVTQRIGRLRPSSAASGVVKQWGAAVHSKTMGPTAGCTETIE